MLVLRHWPSLFTMTLMALACVGTWCPVIYHLSRLTAQGLLVVWRLVVFVAPVVFVDPLFPCGILYYTWW